MKLKDILDGVLTSERRGSDEVEILSLGFDSRTTESGGLFFALPGTTGDGYAYISGAIERGAVAVVCARLPENVSDSVTYVVVEDPAEVMGVASANYYGRPSEKLKLVGVTGTNGKTTTATLLYDLFVRLGYRAGLISTVEYRIGQRRLDSTHTTPDAIRINSMLSEMVRGGCDYCFMEVSSHALVQRRTFGLKFAGGVFTNLTHDHLDYHGSFPAYISAKKSFFDRLGGDSFALVNIDDRNGRVMVQNTRARVVTYSLRAMADFRCRIIETYPDGMLLLLDGTELWVRFIGKFNAYNLLSVYATAVMLGADKQEILTAMSTLTAVAGRLQTVRSEDNVTAVVDYAHTPDALQNVLETLNEIRTSGGKLYTVVGCGGDRDAAKRPLMGQIAVKESDLTIFTSDNPRGENPCDIIREMERGAAGVGRFISITDRREAIRAAAAMASPGDMILVAGKGHETYQIVGGVKSHFDDREEIELAFESRKP